MLSLCAAAAQAIPLLASVGGLLFFFIFIYAVAAVQLFPKTFFDVSLPRAISYGYRTRFHGSVTRQGACCNMHSPGQRESSAA